MKTTIPFTKDILFKSKIAEITSISLEHEINIDNYVVNGNFIVSGDYKTHEVSVNKEEFEYKLPFSVELTENIDLDTFNFEILDFYYDTVGDDTLRVNIEFEVSAQEKTPITETIEVEETKDVEDREDIIPFEEVDASIVDTKLNDIPINNTEEIKEEERLDEAQEQTILNSISESDEEYMTYNIHIVREMETIESICEAYNTTVDMVKEYNNIETLNIGDKIIIPQETDE